MNDFDHQLRKAHQIFVEDHDMQRQRLLDQLDTQSTRPSSSRAKIISRPRLLAAAVAVGALTIILHTNAQAISWPQVAAKIATVQSAAFKVQSTTRVQGEVVHQQSTVHSFLSPEHFHQTLPHPGGDGEPLDVIISPLESPDVDSAMIDRGNRRIVLHRYFPQAQGQSAILQIDRLLRTLDALPEEKVRRGEDVTLDGKPCTIFIASVRDVEPRFRIDGTLKLWIDQDRLLPLRMEASTAHDGEDHVMEVTDIEYDVEVPRDRFRLPTDFETWMVVERWTLSSEDPNSGPSVTLSCEGESLNIRGADWLRVEEPGGESYWRLSKTAAQSFDDFVQPGSTILIDVLGHQRQVVPRGIVPAPMSSVAFDR